MHNMSNGCLLVMQLNGKQKFSSHTQHLRNTMPYQGMISVSFELRPQVRCKQIQVVTTLTQTVGNAMELGWSSSFSLSCYHDIKANVNLSRVVISKIKPSAVFSPPLLELLFYFIFKRSICSSGTVIT